MPEVYTNIEKIDLRIWNIDFADLYLDLEDEAKDILRVIKKNNIALSVSKIWEEPIFRIIKSESGWKYWMKLVQGMGSEPATKCAVREISDEKITQLQIVLDDLKTIGFLSFGYLLKIRKV